MAEVRYENASRIYPGTDIPAVESLNLDIPDGELLVLVGPSGSGKSTALRMLAGLEFVDKGNVYIDNEDVTLTPPQDRDIAMVFQNYALYPNMTVQANMGFALKQQGVPKAERAERVREAARILDLEPFLDRKPKNLSGGQRQRVAMGRAIVRRPQVFLMDEPLSNLDAKLRVQTRTELADLQARLGVTTVYVTHDQQEAMVMSDRIAVFHRGRIEQVAPPEILYEEPERPFVARFIGGNNLVSGSVTAVDGDYCQVDVAGREVVAYRVADCAPGDQVTIAIRPERIGIARSGAAYRNQFPARVEMITFLGDHLVVHVSVDQHTEYLLRIPNIVGHGAMLEGDEITIGWAAADCRALTDHHDDRPPRIEGDER